jgi:MraZ protein
MLLGSHRHSLDAKGRLAIPARFREELTSGLVMTRGFDRCIALYPMAKWEKLAAGINELPVADHDVRQFRRLVYSEAVDAHLDSQGRLLVPQVLQQFAGIEREVVVIGVHTSIELWSLARWQSTALGFDASADEIATRLAGML